MEGLARLEPVRVAMSKMAAGLRGTAALFAVHSALVGAGALASPWLLAPALTLLTGWTAAYAWICWNHGLRAWMIAVDITMMAGLCMMIGQLVPGPVVKQGANWVAALAGIVVICAQLAGKPAVSIPAVFPVTACFVIGSQLAHVHGGGIASASVLYVQAIAAAGTMVIAHRTGRAAANIFADLQKTERAAEIDSVQKADELTQLRLVHNGPLTTLTMAAHAKGARPSELLRRYAAANLEELPRLAAEATIDQDLAVRLDERLAQVVLWHEPRIKVSARLVPCWVPEVVADAFSGAVQEALENVARHAMVERATLELDHTNLTIYATVSDQGRGFAPGTAGFGLREVVTGTMTVVGGTATVSSAPGEGTRVLLEWRHG
jgi:hypothetical protein